MKTIKIGPYEPRPLNTAISGDQSFQVMGMLLASENKYLQYPVYGCLEIWETTTHCEVNSGIFRTFERGKFSAPVVVKRLVFKIGGSQ